MRVFSLVAVAIGLTLTMRAETAGQAAQTRKPAPTPPPRSAQPRTPARAEVAVPFRVGETLTYDVGWQTFLVAGSAVSRVVEKRQASGSAAYYLVAEGRPLPLIAKIYTLYYKMDSLLDSYTALSQRTSLYAEEGTRKRSATTTFDRRARKARYELKTDTTVQDEFTVPQNVQDGLATLYALRSRTFKAGETVTIPVVDDGTLYTATFAVSGPESISVPMGEFKAWNLRITILNAEREPVGSNIAAWISADNRKLPVKLQAGLPVGRFTLTLRTAE
jgi:hypothetical protein